MYSFTEENYLKAIYKLSERESEKITTNSIATMLDTKAASVTDMIKKLSDKKLLKYEKYKGVTLTEKGRLIAVETVRKHRLWEVFLYDKLRFGWEEVHDIAEQLEHIHSELLINKLDDFLGNPTHDPHGDPIPSKNGEIQKSNFVLLSSIKLKQKTVLSGVVDHSAPFLKHLEKTGLLLGKQLEVLEINEYDESVLVSINNAKGIYLSRDVAKNILVKVIK
jgi:DtxR family Mn-dependent transcriptional regulator